MLVSISHRKYGESRGLHLNPVNLFRFMMVTASPLNPWVTEIKEILNSVNAIHVLQNNVPVSNFKIFAKYVTDSLSQQYENKWATQIISKPKLELYRHYKNTPSKESYCKVSLKRGQRSVLAKIRLGVFPINLE